MVKAEPEPKSSGLYPDMPRTTLGFFHRFDLTDVSNNETGRAELSCVCDSSLLSVKKRLTQYSVNP